MAVTIVKVRDFRAGLKKYFDAAKAGDTVLIERDGLIYELTLSDDQPLKKKRGKYPSRASEAEPLEHSSVPSKPLPGGGPGLQSMIDDILQKPRTMPAAEPHHDVDLHEIPYCVYVTDTGQIIKNDLTEDEAMEYLQKYNLDGDLSMGPSTKGKR